MSEENHEATPPQNREGEPENEAPRAKTPLELLRERQAALRGQQSAPGRGSSSRQATNAANVAKRRLHQRRAG